MKRIRYCEKCQEYTLGSDCVRCGEKSVLNTPPKYSLNDSTAKYRRKVKKVLLEKRGLL